MLTFSSPAPCEQVGHFISLMMHVSMQHKKLRNEDLCLYSGPVWMFTANNERAWIL